MNRSIEDILNEPDSDDEEFEFNLDEVERLLQEIDEDFAIPSTSIENSVNVPMKLTLSLEPVIESESDLPITSSIQTFDSPLNDPSYSLQFDDLLLEAFDLARKKEIRFLSQGNQTINQILLTQDQPHESNRKYSQIILTDLEKISEQLKKNDNLKQYGPGNATVIHTQDNFIAIGTSRGQIIVFDWKFEQKQVLAESTSSLLSLTKSLSTSEPPSITAIDSISTGSLLISGTSSGEIHVWELSSGNLLRKITDLHLRKVVRLFRVGFGVSDGIIKSSIRRASVDYGAGYLGSSDSTFHFVSVDSIGTVNYVKFSKQMLRGYVHEANRIFHGRAGVIHDVAPLQPLASKEEEPSSGPRPKSSAPTCNDPSHSGIPPDSSFIAFTFSYPFKSFVVQLQPVVRVASGWRLAEGQVDPESGTCKAGQTASMDWGWMHVSGPITQASDSQSQSESFSSEESKVNPCLFRVCGSTLDALTILYTQPTIKPLDPNESASSATISFALQALKTLDKTEGYSFPTLGSRSFEGENLISVRVLLDGHLALLSLTSIIFVNMKFEEVCRCSICPGLTNTLSLSLNASVPDCTPNFLSVHGSSVHLLDSNTVWKCHVQLWEERSKELVGEGRYVEALTLVLENNDKDMFSFNGKLDWYILTYLEKTMTQANKFAQKSSLADAKNMFSIIADVCVEFCVYGRRLDLLFNDIFRAFEFNGQLLTYFESLEPYILARTLPRLSPEIIISFLEVSAKHQRLSLLERAICHLDPEELHGEFVLRFLLDKGLWSAFLYVRGFGGKDFLGAFQILFHKMLEISYESGSASPVRRKTHSSLQNFPSPDQSDLGYKLLLFLQSCINQHLFPREGSIDIETHHILQIFGLLTQREFQFRPTFDEEESLPQSSLRSVLFPYMYYLCAVDAHATIHCLCQGVQRIQNELQLQHSTSVSSLYTSIFSFVASAQKTIPTAGRLTDRFFSLSLSSLSRCTTPLSDDLLSELVRSLARTQGPSQDSEDLLVPFAVTLCHHHLSSPLFKEALEENNFWGAALELMVGVGDSEEFQSLPRSRRWQWFRRALGFYIDKGIREMQSFASGGDIIPMAMDLIFAYINRCFQIFSNVVTRTENPEPMGLHEELVSVLAKLADLDLLATEKLCVKHLSGHLKDILLSLKSSPKVQCRLVDAILSHLTLEDPSRDLSIDMTAEGVMYYIELLSNYDSSKVYPFLLAHECYPIDSCLLLVRKKGLLDATALLVEKTGDHLAAMDMLLQDLSDKIASTKLTLETRFQSQGLGSTPSPKSSRRIGTLSLNEDDISLISQASQHSQSAIPTDLITRLSLFQTLSNSISHLGAMCLRNSSKSNTSIWFKAFDHLLFEKQGVKEAVLLVDRIMWVLISELVQQLMELMKEVVPAQEIIRRIAQTYAQGANLGEMKDLMSSMLDSLVYETKVTEVLLRITVEDLRGMLLSKTTLQRSGRRFESDCKGLEFRDSPEISLPESRRHGCRLPHIIDVSLDPEMQMIQPRPRSFRTVGGFSKFIRTYSNDPSPLHPESSLPKKILRRISTFQDERERSLTSVGWDNISRTIERALSSGGVEDSTHSLSSLLISDDTLRSNIPIPFEPSSEFSRSTSSRSSEEEVADSPSSRNSFQMSRTPPDSEMTTRGSLYVNVRPARPMIAEDGDFTSRSSMIDMGLGRKDEDGPGDREEYFESLDEDGKDLSASGKSPSTSSSKVKKRKSIWPFSKKKSSASQGSDPQPLEEESKITNNNPFN